MPSTTTTSTVEPAAPADLPRFVVVMIDAPPVPQDTTLTTIDIQSGRTITLVSEEKPPPLLTTDPWRLSGFDVSPDGKSVAFGVLSEPRVQETNGPISTAAAIYVTAVDGSSVPRRIHEISGANPSVWVERFSPDGKWIIGGSQAWTVWPLDGAPVVSGEPFGYPAAGVQWSPDGTQIAYGEHNERSLSTASTMLRFDATQRTLSRVGETASIAGTSPWFTADGKLHVTEVDPESCTSPQDVDSTLHWGLSLTPDGCPGQPEALSWWDTAVGPGPTYHALAVSLPKGVRQAAW